MADKKRELETVDLGNVAAIVNRDRCGDLVCPETGTWCADSFKRCGQAGYDCMDAKNRPDVEPTD